MKSAITRFLIVAVLLITAAACSVNTDEGRVDSVDRHAFNRAALRLNLPLFWAADSDGDGQVGTDEVSRLMFYDSDAKWVEGGAFTPAFVDARERIIAELRDSPHLPEGIGQAEVERRRLVAEDLDHGIPTLVDNDLSDLPADHRAFAAAMTRVSGLIDELYALQNGTAAMAALVDTDDAASQSLFRRNWGPRCVAPRTESNPACNAIAGAPPQIFGIYPASLQDDPEFCQTLASHRDASELLDPFTVVRELDGELVAVELTEAFVEVTSAISDELSVAADALEDPDEDALRAYLRAAAQSFTDNDWEPADEAWSRMNARNSRWFLRVGPDEVYWEPCSEKAGVHMTLALINAGSLTWQDKLTPVRQNMEDEIAALVGAPYAARPVAFDLPDFIDIVINAGDDRDPLGATIGQSLPNWGPVANEGRGRTVAMSNLYTDHDSLEIKSAQAASLLSAETMTAYTSDPMPGLLSTILHEACHNLGPAHEYEVDGRKDSAVFGGGMASTMEELKAQSGALWLVEFLRSRQIISDELARQTYVNSLVWAFDHVARGMYTGSGQRKAYSQLAAIQVGQLLEDGALVFDAELLAANGTDRGAFTVDFERLPQACDMLLRVVGEIKARGDRQAAEDLAAVHVDGETVPMKLISERILRHPKASFVYALEIGGE